MTDQLVLAHLNVKNNRAAMRRLKREGAHAVSAIEVEKIQRTAKGRAYRTTTSNGHPDPRSRNVALLVRKNLDCLGEGFLLGSPSGKVRHQHTRMPVYSAFRHPLGDFLVIVAHPNPSLNLRTTLRADTPMVRGYRRYMSVVSGLILTAQIAHLQPIVMGDLQMPKGLEVPWAPDKLFDYYGLDYKTVGGIDWIAYPKRLKMKRKQVLTGPDHLGMRLTLTR